MGYDKKFFVDVRFEIDAPSSEKAIVWMNQELRPLQNSAVVEHWMITSIIEDYEEELTDENV